MLTDRQEEVLRLIVDIFTTNKIPVGSKTIKDNGINASTATIRNDMVVLEEKGLLEKTHTSSGRIPSYSGYRYYVNNLLKKTKDRNDIVNDENQISEEFTSLNEIMTEAVTSLADLTKFTTFSIGLEKNERVLTGFRFLPLNDRQIVTIIVTDKGTVDSKIISKPQNVTSEEIKTISSIINEKLVGQSLLMVYHKLRTEIPMILQKYFQEPSTIITFINSVLGHIFDDHVYVAGETNLLDYASISNIQEFKRMYEILSNNDNEIIDLLELGDQEIRVQIGNEIDNRFLNDLSLVSGIYEVEGHGKGIIAVLGPTSMPYSKVVNLVENYQLMLKLQLEHYYFELDSMKFDYSN